MVRVLVNGLHAKSGGGVTYLRHMIPELARLPGLDLGLCLHENQRDLFPDPVEGCPIHWARYRDGFVSRLAWEQTALPMLAWRLGAEVTFSPANFGPLLAPGRVILLRNALAVANVESRASKRLYWSALTVMTRLSLATCRRAIAVSAYARDALAPGASSRVEVVPHGVDPMFAPPPADQPRDGFLLSVGDIYVQKNLHGLIEALARVRETIPDVHLKVAGRPVDGEYRDRIVSLISRHGLDAQVDLLDHVRPVDLVELYRRCALFVFPSTVETFGNPLVEAMACGAPIVSSNTAAMPEVLDQAGLYFDPADPAAMALRIIQVLKDDSLRAELSRKSRQRGREFSWRATAARTAAVLRAAAEH